MVFGVLNPEKNWHQKLINLSNSPVSCSHFTLRSPKTSFLTTLLVRTSDFFALPQNKTYCNRDCELVHYIWTMSPHHHVKCRTCWNVGGSEFWKEPVVTYGNLNVTASVQSDHLLHGHTFPVFSPLINRIVHHALQKFSPCLSKPLPQLVRIADWYSIHTLLCHAQM